MTKEDIKNYLEKIYNVNIMFIRTDVYKGNFIRKCLVFIFMTTVSFTFASNSFEV